jgi:hypothetical protein
MSPKKPSTGLAAFSESVRPATPVSEAIDIPSHSSERTRAKGDRVAHPVSDDAAQLGACPPARLERRRLYPTPALQSPPGALSREFESRGLPPLEE